MKYLTDFLNTSKQATGSTRVQAIQDAIALFPEQLPQLLSRPPRSAALARLAFEVVAEAPRTPELCLAAVTKAGAAKQLRASAQVVLTDYEDDRIVAAFGRWLRSPYTGAVDAMKTADAVAGWGSEPLAVAMYQALEHHDAEKARQHAVAALQARGASPVRPWSAWRLDDEAKSAALFFGWPSSEGGVPKLEIPPHHALKPLGSLAWFDAVWDLDERGCQVGHMRHHDVTLVFDNVPRPTLTRWDHGEVSSVRAMDKKLSRGGMSYVTLAPHEATRAAAVLSARQDAAPRVAAIVATHLGDAAAADASALLDLDRAVAEAIVHEARMEGIHAYVGPVATRPAFTAQVAADSDLDAVARIVTTAGGAPPSGPVVYSGPSRSEVWEITRALRDAGHAVTLASARVQAVP